MNCKKAKRALSMLLAVMMLIGMIPINGMAAGKADVEFSKGSSTATYVTIDVMGAKVLHKGDSTDFASNVPFTTIKGAYTGSTSAAASPNKYDFSSFELEVDSNTYMPVKNDANDATLVNYAAKSNALFQDETSKGTTALEVSKGETFYIAAKATLTDTTNTYKGLAQDSIEMVVPTDAFSTNCKGNNIILNNMVTGNGKGNQLSASSIANVSEYLNKYGASFTVASPNDGVTLGNGTGLAFTLSATADYYLPTETTWDFMIPVTVKLDAIPGDYYIGVGNKTGYNVNTVKNGSSGITSSSTKLAIASEQLQSNAITVRVISNDPTASIPAGTKVNPAADQSVAVTLTNGTFASALDAAKFEVQESDGTAVSGAVTGVTRTSDTVATLTIDGTKLTSSKTYKVKVLQSAYTATAGQAADLTTAANISVKATMDGSVTIDNTSPTYGDTLTATYASGSATAAYQWYRGNDAISSATSATYTVGKGDVGKTLTVEVSDSAGNLYGTVASTATSAVGAKTLTKPSTITGIPSINKDATNKTVTGTYTFKTGDGIVGTDNVTVSYTATYNNVTTAGPVSDVGVTLGSTLGGTDAACYTFAGATLSNQSGTVTDKGYALLTSVTTSQGTSVTLTATEAVLQAGENTTVTIGTLAEAEEIVSVSADKGTATWTSGNTFTYTAPSDAPASKENVTITITTKFGQISAGVAITTKKYDGTDTATIDKVYKLSDSTKADIGGDYTSLTVKFADAEVGVSKNAYLTSDTNTVTVGGKTYKITTVESGEITKADAADATAQGAQVNKNADLDALLDSIAAAEIKVGSIDVAQGTVGDYFKTTNAFVAALVSGGYYTEEVTATVCDTTDTVTAATDSSTTPITSVVKGDTYTFTNVSTATFTVDGASKTADEMADVFEIDTTNNTIKVNGAIADNTVVTVDSTTAITFGTSVTVAEPADAVLTLGSQVQIDLTFGTTTGTTLSDGTTPTMLAKNFSEMSGKKLTVTVPVKKSSGSSADYISFNTNGLATASITEAEIEDGKITELPTVTNVVKGVMFKGWSTDGTAAHIIDIDTYSSAEDGDELIAVFEGYMTGNGKGIVRPGANVNRAEFAKMLVIAAGIYDSSVDYGTSSFTDFDDATSWAIPYVACAEKAGIIDGYETSAGKVFKPAAAITREEAAKMIAKAFGVVTTEGATTDKVTDFASVGSWAQQFVAALCDNGTINGYESEDGYVFKAKNPIRRCEAAKMINCYIGLDDTDRASITADTTVVNPFTDITGNTKWAYADLMFASLSVGSSYYVTEITMPTID